MDPLTRLTIGSVDLQAGELGRIMRQGLPAGNRFTRISGIEGPFDGKINSIYKVRLDGQEGATTVMFRARVSEAFRYENVVKEKILFPMLNGMIDTTDEARLENAVSVRVAESRGSFIFPVDSPPAIPVQDLLYFDETREDIPFMFSVMSFIDGISLYEHVEHISARDRPARELPGNVASHLESMFREAGSALGMLHGIEFPAFYPSITSIGDPGKATSWKPLFTTKITRLLKEARTHRAFLELADPVERYIMDKVQLIPDDDVAVLFHNDFQPQNFIVDPGTGHVKGFIDFDNWGIAPREQDLVKMKYWGLKDMDPRFDLAFMDGYRQHQHVDDDFMQKVALYTMAWFILVFNFEMDKFARNEINATVDRRFPAAEKYLNEMRAVLYHQ